MKKLFTLILSLFCYFNAISDSGPDCTPIYSLDLADTTTYDYDCGQIINPGQWVVSVDSCSLWTPFIVITDTPSHIEINIDITGNLENSDTAWVWFYLNSAWILDTFYLGNDIPSSGKLHLLNTSYTIGDTIQIKIIYKNDDNNEGWMLKDKSIRICGDLLPTPIDLIYFRADVTNNNKVNLTWTTASESNNDYFEIERTTTDFYYFESIGIIKGAGISNETKTYFFQDNYPHGGVNYYRLKQVDFDGQYEYSNFVSAEYPKEDKINLIFSLNKIFVSTNEEIGRIIVTDLTGSVKASSVYNNYVRTSQMATGIYMIFVFDTEDQIIFKRKFSNHSLIGGSIGELLEEEEEE